MENQSGEGTEHGGMDVPRTPDGSSWGILT